jgi:DNA polymerase-3 subunit delta
MLNNIDQIIEKRSYPPILLMFGEEEYLLESDYNKLIKSMFQERKNEYDFEVFDGDTSKIRTIVDSCLSFPFMSEKRVVVVKNFDKMINFRSKKISPEFKSFEKYLDSPQETSVLILKTNYDKLKGFANATKSNKTMVINKILKDAKFPFDRLLQEYEWIEYPKMYESSYPAWIKQKAGEAGKTLTAEAIQFLIAQTNLDLRSVSNELEKAIVFVKEKKRIDLDDMSFVVGVSHKYNVFELQKAVGNRDLQLSLRIVENMLANEAQEMLILTMVGRYFIILWKMLELAGRNKSNADIAREVGVSPFFVQEYFQALGKYKPAEIERAITLLTATDELLKSSSQNSTAVIQKMVMDIIEK